ncbi:MAG TPA: MFS transporter, partial [Terriglobales bacterium]|nr:MFS transporter [Terriglobales bacterium]
MDWRQLKDSIVDPESERLVRWQLITVVLLVTGYAGYYLCRSNLSVAMPYIIRDMVRDGYDPSYARISLGRIVSAGVFAYALGKFISGGAADLIGGRRSFLIGMGGSIACTMMFALSGAVPTFTVAWVFNRIFQTTGWVGMVKLSSRWFSYSSYGTVMGVLSLSWLFGDAISRAFMGMLLDFGLDWAGVFFIGASILGALLFFNLWLLKESPADIGEREPHGSPTSLFAEQGDTAEVDSLGPLLRQFLRSRAFLCICALSLGFTLIRETFNTWTPLYFTEAVGLSGSAAAQSSALFPFLGGISVVLAGIVSDRLGASGRAAMIFVGLLLTATTLLILGWADLRGSSSLPVLLIALT